MYASRIMIALLIFLFIPIISGPCLADTRCGGDNVRGILCAGVFVSPLEDYREIPPGGTTTFEIEIYSNLYNNTEVWLWLDGIPEFWDVKLNISHFNLNVWERITVELTVSTPPTASVNYTTAIIIGGMYIFEDHSYVGSVFTGMAVVRIIGPDLRINPTDIEFSNDCPVEGQCIGVMATIHNIGDIMASDISVRFLVDDEQVGEVQNIPVLVPGKSVLVFGTWKAAPGNHTVIVEIDYKDSIDEYSEANNAAITTLSVEETPFKWAEYITALSVVLCIPVISIWRKIKS